MEREVERGSVVEVERSEEIKGERWREGASEREVIPGALLVNNGRVIRQDLLWSRWLRDSLKIGRAHV